MHVKSVLFVGVIGALASIIVGGGIYGFYLNKTTKIVLTQADAYHLVAKCALLEDSRTSDPQEIEALLREIEEKVPGIFTTNLIIGSLTGQPKQALPFNQVLAECGARLKAKIPNEPIQ